MSPTEDTPQERDDKATALEAHGAHDALRLARQLRRFRWETRALWALTIVMTVVAINTR